MKNIKLNIRRVSSFLLMMIFAVAVSAQTLRTGYFMDGNLFRYRLNPSFVGQRGYVSLPVLGGVNINTMGNLGMGDLIYDSPLNNDKLVTFMHSSVSEKEFLDNIDDNNVLRLDLDMTLLSLAFHAFGGYNSIDLSLRSHTGMNLPYDMLKFMKVMGAENYSFSDLCLQSRNFADLSLGHSRYINKNLSVGGRLKFLFGLGYADVLFDKMNINMNGDSWMINAKGEANIALGGAYTYSDEPTMGGKTVVDGYDNVAVGLHGFGMGIDLGASYDLSDVLLKGLIVSASVNDLGFISWNKTARAAIDPKEPYVFNGFNNMAIHSGEGTLDDQFEGLSDDMEDFLALEDKGEGSVTTGIGAKLNLGIEYKMPFYDRLSAGLLYTHCFDDVFSYNQASLMLAVSPVNVLDFAVSGTLSDYGAGFGAMANLHCPGFSFFVGTDCFVGKVGKQFIPLENMNASVSFGINIAFGRHKTE